MPSERWQRANDLFEQAVALPAEERSAFLKASCGGDATLQAAVARWLEADDQADGFLDDPVVPLHGVPPQPSATEPPRQLGPYRVLEEVGRGGMGVVYRGIRDDEAFRREVAIKILLQGGISSEARRRLDIERRILASLDHPGVARVYDGGTAPSGLPFLVMEYVEGEPIDRYCEQHGLAVRERVTLFRLVCEAVHASHQSLIVHCDLKPSNILVTEKGHPKLLDFGIAKLLSDKGLGTAGAPITRWPRPLTPEYASPEQIRGEAISTVSDVYALGVLLFKLLTGQRPHRLEGLTAAEVEDRLGTAPARPSAVAALRDAADHARQIRGDLDAIVLKAMRSEPAQRYGSAEQLSADLGRYLDGFSVDARQGDTRYRLGKFVQRHRAAVAIAVLFVGLLSAYAFSMASMASKLAAQQVVLENMNQFALGIFDVGSPVDEIQPPTLLDAVHKNVALIDQLHPDQPVVRAAVLGTAADIYIRLEEPEHARSLAEQALAIHAAIDGEDSLPYANAQVRLGAALTVLEEHERAEAVIRDGLGWLRQHPEVEPKHLVRTLNALVYDYCYRGDHTLADAMSAEALRVAQGQLDPQSEEAAAAGVQRASVLSHLGRLDKAEALYLQGLERYERLLHRDHPYRATLLNNLGKIYLDQKHHARAWETYQQADAQYVKAYGESASPRIKPLVGMGKAASAMGNHAKALSAFREALDVSLPLGNAKRTAQVATMLADYLIERGDCGPGEDLLRQSVEVSRVDAGDRSSFEELVEKMVTCGFARRGEPGAQGIPSAGSTAPSSTGRAEAVRGFG